MRFFTSSFSCFFLAKPTKIAVQFQYCNSFNHIIFVYQNQKGAPIHCGIAISMWSIMPLPPSRTHHRPTTIFLFHITIFFLFSSLYIWSLALIIFIILVHFGFDVTTKKKLFILFTPTTISNEYNVLYDMTDNRSRPPTRRTRARHHWWTNWKENNKKIRTCMCIYLSVHFWQDQLFRSIGLV